MTMLRRLWDWIWRELCPYCRRPVDDCTRDPRTHQDPP